MTARVEARAEPGGLRGLALWVLLLALGPGSASGDGFCAPPVDLGADLEPQEVRVTLREVEGSRAKEGCAVGLVTAPAAKVFAVLGDADRYDEYMPHVQSSEVERLEDGSYHNHQVLDLPFPIRNRHYTVHVRPQAPAEGEESTGRWSLPWTYVEGSGNMNENEGSWTLVPLSGETTLLVYRVRSDPGGLIPKWALNRATKRTLPDLFEAVRRRVAEMEPDSPSGSFPRSTGADGS